MQKGKKKRHPPKTKLAEEAPVVNEKTSDKDTSNISSFSSRDVEAFGIKVPLMIMIGVVIGIILSYIFFTSKPELFIQPIIANAVRATVAALPTPVSATHTPPLPTLSPTAPMIQFQPTPIIDVLVKNDFDTWPNPTNKIKINANQAVIIEIDPQGLHQTTCSNWNVQPYPLSLIEENECRLAFQAVSNYETEVTVTITVDGVIMLKSFAFRP